MIFKLVSAKLIVSQPSRLTYQVDNERHNVWKAHTAAELKYLGNSEKCNRLGK